MAHNASVWSTSNTGGCQASQTNASDGVAWAFGTYVCVGAKPPLHARSAAP